MVDELSGSLARSHSLEMYTPVFTLSMTLTVHERLYKVPLMGSPISTISTLGAGTAGERGEEREREREGIKIFDSSTTYSQQGVL